MGPILALIYVGILFVLGHFSDKWLLILCLPIGLLLILAGSFLESRTSSRPTTRQHDCLAVVSRVQMPRDLRGFRPEQLRGEVVETRTWSSRGETGDENR